MECCRLLHVPSIVRYLRWKHMSEQLLILRWALHPDKLAITLTCCGDNRWKKLYFSLLMFTLSISLTCSWTSWIVRSKISADFAICCAAGEGKRNKARRSLGFLGCEEENSIFMLAFIALLTFSLAIPIVRLITSMPIRFSSEGTERQDSSFVLMLFLTLT